MFAIENARETQAVRWAELRRASQRNKRELADLEKDIEERERSIQTLSTSKDEAQSEKTELVKLRAKLELEVRQLENQVEEDAAGREAARKALKGVQKEVKDAEKKFEVRTLKKSRDHRVPRWTSLLAPHCPFTHAPRVCIAPR